MTTAAPHRFLARAALSAAAAALCLGVLAPAAGAVTRGSSTPVTAGVFIGGDLPVLPSTITILHSPLIGVSDVTGIAIIQGEAGENPIRGGSFAGRNKPPGGQGFPGIQADGDPMIVTVFYRIVDPQNPGAPPPFEDLADVGGLDPMSFAFQITRSSVTEGNLQYKIRARRFNVDGSTDTVFFPEGANETNDIAVTVGVDAQAAAVIGPEGGRVIIHDGNPNDGQTMIDVPAGVLPGPVTFNLDEIPANDPVVPRVSDLSNPVSVYRLDTDRPVNGVMRLSVLYPDFEFPSGQDGILDGTQEPVSRATIFWWDGFQWRAVGGQNDTSSNVLVSRVSKSGFYTVATSHPLSPKERRPMEKIVTPNGDGVNDSAVFSFGGLAQNVEVEIIDMTGHKVRTIFSSNSFEWDGRDDSGKIVESGVYIYQYKVDGQRVSGLIAVAK